MNIAVSSNTGESFTDLVARTMHIKSTEELLDALDDYGIDFDGYLAGIAAMNKEEQEAPYSVKGKAKGKFVELESRTGWFVINLDHVVTIEPNEDRSYSRIYTVDGEMQTTITPYSYICSLLDMGSED